MADHKNKQGIAVIGVSCRFPQAHNPEAFWQLIAEGRTVFQSIPEDRLLRHSFNGLEGIKAGFLENPYLFDNQRFNIPDAEAQFMDPQQRVMLELAIEAIADTGYAEWTNQRAGVFVGTDQLAHLEMISSRWYRQKAVDHLLQSESFQRIPVALRNDLQDELTTMRTLDPLPPHTLVDNLGNMIPGRIAHELNLKGPAFAVDTACSSSLVAVHLACESLYRHECDLALAGGVNLNLSPSVFQYMQAAGVISPTGKCIPFSKDSDGILLGEGAGLVALKRLDEALRDQDPIWAVIRGSGINNDGRSLGLMAPAWKGQLALLQHTYSRSGFDPGRISAIESHGTSTRIGDGVELSVIEKFFPLHPGKPISVGSVKSNIGHTLGTAGIAGLIKMLLAIQHRQLPPSLHEEIDPSKNLAEKGIQIQSALADWKHGGLRCAAVSSFGFGGTNAHLILEEPEKPVLPRLAPNIVFTRKTHCYDFFPQLQTSNTPLLTLAWQETEAVQQEKTYQPASWLLLGFEEENLRKMQTILTQNGQKQYAVHCLLNENQPAFTRLSESDFRIDAGNPEHYRWLMANFPDQEELGILFLGNRSGLETDLSLIIRKELSGFRYLFAALRQKEKARIWVATFGAFSIRTGEQSRPDQRALSALAAGALEENPEQRGALIDLGQSEANFDTILFQALGVVTTAPSVIRDGQFYAPALKPARAKMAALQNSNIKTGGTYLLLGASSGIGALMAEYLVRLGARKVVVSGTRPPEQVDGRLTALMSRHMEYVQCSTTNKDELAQLLETLYVENGEMDGIIYAAGRIAPGSLINKKQADFEQVLSSKIAGVHHLAECLKDRRPGFVYLLSSISGLTPAWAGGMADYAAANAFMDAFAEKQSNGPVPWISCSWALWENTGMAIKLGDQAKGFTSEDGLAIFNTSLATGLPHVIALPAGQQGTFSQDFSEHRQIPLPPKMTRPANPEPPEAPAPVPAAPKQKGPAASTEMLRQFIAEAVEMPVEDVDVQASFYQLGLDSLSAVDVAQKIEAQTGLTLHPTILFEHDTILALGKYLDQQQTGQEPAPEPAPAHTVQAVSDRFPLIGAQKTFYAQQQFHPDKPCNVLVTVCPEKPFDPTLLQTAWNKLAAKHDALRLAFEMTDQGPMQYVLPDIDAPVEFRECAAYAEVLAYEDELVNRVFELDKPPFYQLAHVSWPDGNTALMLMMHHLVFDAWSMYILLKDLLEEYEHALRGEESLLDSSRPAFEAYVQFHKETLVRKDFSSVRAYWTQALDNAVWSLPLPYKTQNGQPGRYSMVIGELSAVATQQRMQQNQEQRLSIFHTMLAAYFLTLHRHTGRNDMIIRVANANRDAAFPEIESLTGCLADALPLRVSIEPGDSLLDVAQKVKQQMLEALRHTGLSSQDIAELPIGRQDDGPVVLSPVGLSFVPMHHLSRESGFQFSAIRCRTALPFTDISLICFLEKDVLKCCWNFDEALFETDSIEKLKDTFLQILQETAPSPPPHPVPGLEMPKVHLYPDHTLLHEKVWTACERFAEKQAVVSAAGNLSYTELARQSRQLANTLIGHLKPGEETVGIYAYPGVMAVVGLTGTLASGRAFIPLDPDWPSGRTEMILAHAGIRTIVTTKAFLPQLEHHGSITSILVLDVVAGQPSENGHSKILSTHEASATHLSALPFELTPQHPAYVMYTSGTSGHPKGVMVSHQAVEVFLNWISETFRITEQDRFIHTSSLGFGGSIRQVFSTLLAGATIYPIERAELKDPQALLQFLDRHQISLLNTVPSVINNLLEWVELSGNQQQAYPRLEHLRYVLLGGEALYAETLVKWLRLFGNSGTIVNLYGSTETIVNATVYFSPRETAVERGVVPIGYQKKGSLVRLFNEKGSLCRPGEVGQIFVGGPCLAMGYYHEPELSRQKFVHLSLPGAEGLFYATGDLAQADETGLLHFIGRNDDQIQLHGNRIELTEIEDTIYQTHQVKNTAVVDYRSGSQHWLAAFVELSQTGIQPSAQQIRDFIAQRLPGYMVPHKVILLDKLPLNQAGKTDRVALRHQLAAELSDEKDKSASTEEWSATERTIAAVWQKLLRVSTVHRDDDFFRLGGDSIMALEMLHHLRKHFHTLPQAVSLFKDRKLRALAGSIDRLNANPAAAKAPALAAEVRSDKHALSPSQKGFVLLRKLIPTSAPNWSGILQFRGIYRADRLTQALEFLLSRHPMLRTVFLSEGAQTWQQVLDHPQAPVTVYNISEKPSGEQQQLLHAAFEEIQNTDFDLSQYPLFQVQLYQTGDQSAALIICMHHIITDGWSTHILINDLLRAYDQIMEGAPPHLAPQPPLYTEVVPYLADTAADLEHPAMQAHLAYWEKTLTDIPAFIPPADIDKAGRSVNSFLLPATTKEQLLHWSKARGVTLYNLMLTLYARALMQMYSQQDLLINTAVSGRDLPIENIQHIVGCFARNLPLRMVLDPQADLSANAKTVESVFFEALEHQDVPSTALFKIATRIGHSTAIFSVNRFYFSFMDFSALEKYPGRQLSLLWEDSTFSFSAGGAGSEIMMGVDVSDKIRINLNGYASPALKERLKSILLDEIAALTGTARTIDSALIAYLPGAGWLKTMLPQAAALTGNGNWKNWLMGDRQPKLLEHMATRFGRSGVVFLPYDADELRLFTPETRTQEILSAIRIAREHGATHISMAGTLPAMTNYGYSIVKAMQAAEAGLASVVLTTGHASTVSAVVKTIQKVLTATAADLGKLKVAVLGFGSIGQASALLMLKALGHPAELVIVDLEAQLPHLVQTLADLKAKFNGKLTISLVRDDQMPDTLYDADLVIGASSSGQLLDVQRFKPGAVLVDDSFPPVLDIQSGIRRMQQAADVLLVGGGKLQIGDRQSRQLDPAVPENVLLSVIRNLGDDGMPGCRAEPLVLQTAPDLAPTIGLVNEETAWQYWQKINALGIDTVALHLAGFGIPDSLLENIRAILSKQNKNRIDGQAE
ncbi:MAG: amino acid adenylation domain-containing protein [Bacteroidetes bacterium]|nr:MAG: amino acid adenylation domain-containing protein [Bacteroidota bacterium]